MKELKIIHSGGGHKTEVFVDDEIIGLIQEIHITAQYPFVEIVMLDLAGSDYVICPQLKEANDRSIELLREAGVEPRLVPLL